MLMIKDSETRQEFLATRNLFSTLLNNFADVALVRGAMVSKLPDTPEEQGIQKEPKREPLADPLHRWAERVATGTPFRVAVVGEFTRGKSTLINSLLGREILTTSILPNTAARTVLKHGEPERLRVTYTPASQMQPREIRTPDLKSALPEFTSDSAVNSEDVLRGNRKSLAQLIEEVEVWCASEFLDAKEMELIDTPGLGSVFPQHKDVTYKVIPQVDATLFLVQADPGLGTSEIDFLKYMKEHVNHIFFILTKADQIRSEHELQQVLNFLQTTMATRADIQVENLYAVSAQAALEGDLKQSRFDQFVPALETFLVRSSGAARLKTPLMLVRTHLRRLAREVERDIKALDQSLGELQTELNRLQGQKERIQAARDRLLKETDQRIQDLTEIATDGMDGLPSLIRTDVEKAIDEMSVKELLKMGDRLQLISKESVEGWLKKKEQRFESSALTLQHELETQLREIMSTIEAGESPPEHSFGVDVTTPTAGGGLWSGVPSALGRGTVSLTAGFGAALLLTAITSSVIIVLPIAVGAIVAIGQLFGVSERARDRVKANLSAPLPGNDKNYYESIVEGFEQEGQYTPGLKTGFENELLRHGSELKRVIVETVTTNLDSRLDQLQQQISQKAGGQQDRAKELARLADQKEKLDAIGHQLDQISNTVMELSQ